MDAKPASFGGRIGLRDDQGEMQGQTGSAWRTRSDLDLTSVELDNALSLAEPEAEATASFASREKRIEQMSASSLG